MGKDLFQQKALDSAAEPERLSSAIRLVQPSFAGAVGLVGILILVFLVWSILTTVPITVAGKGIILDRGGISSISAKAGGQVTRVSVAVGQHVDADTIVVELAQEELADQLQTAKLRLAGLRDERQKIVTFNDLRRNTQAEYADAQRTRLSQALKEQRQLLATYQRQLRERQDLLKEGVIAKTTVIDTESQVASTQAEIAATEQQLAELDEQPKLDAIEDAQRLLDVDLQIADAQRAAQQTQSEFDRRSAIKAPVSGLVTEIRIAEGDVIAADMVVMTILPHHPADGEGQLYGYLFVPADKGAAVRQQMEVKVYPSTVKRQEFGFIPGSVASVSALPVSDEEMLRYTRNRALVENLLQGGVAFQARVKLPTADTRSGFKWSSSDGPPFLVGHGTEFDAEVAVRRVRLIAMILPFTEKLFPIPEGN